MADEYVLKQNVIDTLISDKVEITAVHRAIGGERDFEVLNATCDRHADMVTEIPAADVVKVVRCKDCIHYEMGVCLKIYDDGTAAKEAWQERKPDDFCSYGERRGNNG